MIILTDGAATWEVENTIPEADSARAQNVVVVSIGIEDTVDEQQLLSIAGGLTENMFLVNEFDQLVDNVENVLGVVFQYSLSKFSIFINITIPQKGITLMLQCLGKWHQK